MRRIDVVSAIVHNENGELLIVKNAQGDSFYWSLPGGAAEAGETLEQAVMREVKEEAGLTVAVRGLSSVRERFFPKPQHHVLFITFFAEVIGGELGIHDPDNDIVEVRWADKETAKTLLESFYDLLKLESDAGKTPAFYTFEGSN